MICRGSFNGKINLQGKSIPNLTSASDGSHLMAIDNTLLWVLIGTAAISLLTLVYVIVDENAKRRRYERQKEQQKQAQAEQAAAEIPQPAQAGPSLEGEAGIPTVSPASEPASEQPSPPEAAVNPSDSGASESGKTEGETPDLTEHPEPDSSLPEGN